jgi:hypothetical protein
MRWDPLDFAQMIRQARRNARAPVQDSAATSRSCPQQLLEFGGGQGRSTQIAAVRLATMRREEVRLLAGLDTHCNEPQPEVAGPRRDLNRCRSSSIRDINAIGAWQMRTARSVRSS